MSVSEIVNISKIINARSMKFSKNFSNRNMLKVASFCVPSPQIDRNFKV